LGALHRGLKKFSLVRRGRGGGNSWKKEEPEKGERPKNFSREKPVHDERLHIKGDVILTKKEEKLGLGFW